MSLVTEPASERKLSILAGVSGAAVASGAADAGLGIEVAARSRGLDFVPLIQEDYYLVCLKSALEQPPVQALLAVLRSERWRALVAGLPGYDPQGSGEVLSLRRQLPWWDFARPRRRPQKNR